jgi:hypothetical protein
MQFFYPKLIGKALILLGFWLSLLWFDKKLE